MPRAWRGGEGVPAGAGREGTLLLGVQWEGARSRPCASDLLRVVVWFLACGNLFSSSRGLLSARNVDKTLAWLARGCVIVRYCERNEREPKTENRCERNST